MAAELKVTDYCNVRTWLHSCPRRKKTWLHLVSSSFERWTFSIDFQCVFQSGSRRIQILCNFISLVPSVQHIKFSSNDTAWDGALLCFGRLSCCVFLELYIFTEGALQSLQGVIFQEFCHRTPKQRLVWIQHGFCQIFMGSYSKDERNNDSFTLAVLVLVYSSFLQMQLNLKQFPFSCRVYYTHSSNWTHKDTVSD